MQQIIHGGAILSAVFVPSAYLWAIHVLLFVMAAVTLLDLYFIWRRCSLMRRKLTRRRERHGRGGQ